jgi:hypothetical protein
MHTHTHTGNKASGEGLVVSRVARGAVPVLMSLPPPPSEALPEWWQPHGAGSSRTGNSERGQQQDEQGEGYDEQLEQQPKRRGGRAATYEKAPANQSKRGGAGGKGGVGVEPVGEGEGGDGSGSQGGGGGGAGEGVLLGLLGQLLEESSVSMRGLGPIETAAQKAQWWKVMSSTVRAASCCLVVLGGRGGWHT